MQRFRHSKAENNTNTANDLTEDLYISSAVAAISKQIMLMDDDTRPIFLSISTRTTFSHPIRLKDPFKSVQCSLDVAYTCKPELEPQK